MKTNEKYFKTIRVVAAIIFIVGGIGVALALSAPLSWVGLVMALAAMGTAALLYACNDRHETDWTWYQEDVTDLETKLKAARDEVLSMLAAREGDDKVPAENVRVEATVEQEGSDTPAKTTTPRKRQTRKDMARIREEIKSVGSNLKPE